MIPAEKKFTSKTFLIALPVIILALTELVIFVLVGTGAIKMSVWTMAVLLIVLTCIATGVILYLYDKLVKPLRLAKHALNNYVVSQELPQMPEDAKGETALLLTNIHATISQLDALNVEKTDMIDLLSHDLRSPVGRILSLSTLIKEDPDADIQLYSDYITNECKGLLRMLENILLMLKEDNHVFGMCNVNMKKIIAETTSFFDFSMTEKGLLLDVDIDESIYIHVQPDLFTQAVRNILGNAIKFSPNGKTIRITGIQEDDNITLCIKDEGLGLKPEDVTRIFDRFTKAGKKGTHGEASVGLGLYLSKKIVEKHAGQLIASSEGINKGAAFTIILHKLITKKPQEKSVKMKVLKQSLAAAKNA